MLSKLINGLYWHAAKGVRVRVPASIHVKVDLVVTVVVAGTSRWTASYSRR